MNISFRGMNPATSAMLVPENQPVKFAPEAAPLFGSAKQPFPLKITKLPAPIAEPGGLNLVPVYNPGAITDERNDGGVHMLMRFTQGKEYPDRPFFSVIGYAHSKDGILIDTSGVRTVFAPNEPYTWGYEDPRITKIDDRYYIVMTGYDGKTPQINLVTTTNFKEFNNVGMIGPQGVDDKDAFFHPGKVVDPADGQEKFMLYHRVSSTGNIQYVLAESIEQLKDPDFWKEQMKPEVLEAHTLMKKRPGTWENKLGGGIPPIKTKDGWLFVYHASSQDRVYRGGVALLDLNDPRKVIHRSPDFIMEPELEYETKGPVPNVVFPQGYTIREDLLNPGNPDLYIYYGAADKNVGLAKVKLDHLLEYVKQFDADGNTAGDTGQKLAAFA